MSNNFKCNLIICIIESNRLVCNCHSFSFIQFLKVPSSCCHVQVRCEGERKLLQMGRSSSNQNKRQTTIAPKRRCLTRRKNLLDHTKYCEGGNFDETIHRSKKSKAVNDTISFTCCFKEENIENEHVRFSLKLEF